MDKLKLTIASGMAVSLLLGFAGGFFFRGLTDNEKKSECAISMNTSRSEAPRTQVQVLRAPAMFDVAPPYFPRATDFSFPDLSFDNFSDMQADMPVVKDVDGASELQVIAKVPGMSMKDLRIEIGNSHVTINGHHEEQANSSNNFSSRNESFSRTVHLPYPVNRNRAKSTIMNDVLTISLPKLETERHEQRQIDSNYTSQI